MACGERSSTAPRRLAAGFTLLEVLVALVIVGVALAAAMRGAMTLTNNARDARLKLLAVLTAENQLLELRLARGQLTNGEFRHDCEQGGVRFVCDQVVKETPNPFFRRVEVSVSGVEGDASRRYAELLAVLPTN